MNHQPMPIRKATPSSTRSKIITFPGFEIKSGDTYPLMFDVAHFAMAIRHVRLVTSSLSTIYCSCISLGEHSHFDSYGIRDMGVNITQLEAALEQSPLPTVRQGCKIIMVFKNHGKRDRFTMHWETEFFDKLVAS